MEWVYIAGSIFSAYVLLSIVGGERQRRLSELDLKANAKDATAGPEEPVVLKAVGSEKPH